MKKKKITQVFERAKQNEINKKITPKNKIGNKKPLFYSLKKKQVK